MHTVEQALNIVRNTSTQAKNLDLQKVSEALGHIVYEDIISPINMPPFRQSAMDGYALSLNDSKSYKIIGEVKAGDNAQPILKKGEAIRIFTGAPVPETANAIIIQEKVSVENNVLSLNAPVLPEDNIRPMGEQVLKGQIALKKGTLLTPAAIGFLTSLGIKEINIFKKPSIAVVVTGNELIQIGEELAHGQIYESNAIMLTLALDSLGFKNTTTYKVDDNYNSTIGLLDQVISNHDMVLVSGGISVGDYDYVGQALAKLDVKELFYKVKQKPGKPLFFGKKNETLIFALPGNPAAALTCFYIYVQLALQKLSGNSNFSVTTIKAKSKSAFTKKGDRAQFLKAIYNSNTVEILEGQNSSMLHTFALGNALVFLSEENNSIDINDEVEVILLPIN